ncbi:tetraspanin-2A [Galendromus occidentalis]|uniref:Tetraspanin n=1 Tax=Galendromus occidentalis TaxID=34638 RepID=A0AAJ6QPI3_9ACAR|nr:tetraspanin-2A [Galendromus occidentalis]
MELGTFILKQVNFVISLIIWLLGLTLLFLSIWIRSDPNFWEFQEHLNLGNYYAACYVAMVVGALLLVVGFMGCVGTFVDSPCILWTYMIFTVFFIVLEITIAILVWQIPSGEALQKYMENEINRNLVSIYNNEFSRRFMDLLQIHMECCGAVDKTDYKRNHLTIPQSCSNYRTNNIYIYGCSENMRVHLQRIGAGLGGLSLSLVLVQSIALCVNFLLLVNLKSLYAQVF